MKLSDVLTTSFQALGHQLGLKIEFLEGRLVVIEPRWRQALSTESLFCRALVACGYITERQMQRAARRYRLGATTRGGVIFWQIDQEDVIYDGKVMYYREDCHRDKEHHPTWVSTMLKKRYQWPDADRLTTQHCLFGLHLLYNSSLLTLHSSLPTVPHSASLLTPHSSLPTVCVVESEKTAVILSEHFPQFLWLATGGMGNVQPKKFHPLRGRKVILFPDTDPEGETFKAWYKAAQEVMRQPFWEDSPPITVSPVLEQHATPEQKAAKIDLVDFLFDP